MTTPRRISTTLAAVALLALLAGCLPLPFPPVPGGATTSAPDSDTAAEVDVAAMQALFEEAMPVVTDDFIVVDYTGLDDDTFGSDWSEVDHDATRVARMVRTFESPGWADGSLGPGYWIDFEVVLMESPAAADAALTDIAFAARSPYTIDAEDGTSKTEYEPLDASGRFPFGAIEQTRRQVWSTGERSVGWIGYFGAGPFIGIAYSSAVPNDADTHGLADFTSTHLAGFVEAVEEMPQHLE